MYQIASPASVTHPTLDPEFQRLPVLEREKVVRLWALMERLEKVAKLSPALRAAAADHAHLGKGWCYKSLEARYYAWKAERDWRSLADKRVAKTARKNSDDEARVGHPEFVDFVAKYVTSNNRKTSRALASLLRDWERGNKFPVYGTWRDHWTRMHPGIPLPDRCPMHRNDLPFGWSKRNLFRVAPKKAALALARHGFAAAAPFQVYPVRDVSRLRPLELVTADDFRLDILCKVSRELEIDGRRFPAGIHQVVGIAYMDVATRKVISIGFKLAAKDDDGRRMALSRADMAFLLGDVIRKYGLPQDYPITLLTENASAAFTSEMKQTIFSIFGEKIRLEHTGLWHDALVAGGWREGGGKPYQKGWIEAYFSLLHSAVAMLPGQIGARYDLEPGDMQAKRLYAEKMIEEALSVGGEEVVSRLRLPFLEYEALQEAVLAATRLLNLRIDHNLKSHRVINEYRFPEGSTWYSESQIVNFAKHDLLRLVSEDRRESPEERWRDLCRAVKFARVPESMLAPLLSAPRAKAAPRRGAIRFTHRNEEHVFFHADLPPELFHDDRRYTLHWHDSEPDICYLYEPATLAFIAAVPRLSSIDPLDRAAGAPVLEQVFRARNRLLADHRRVHAGEAEKIAADREHNATVLNRARIAGLTLSDEREEVPACVAPEPGPLPFTKRKI